MVEAAHVPSNASPQDDDVMTCVVKYRFSTQPVDQCRALRFSAAKESVTAGELRPLLERDGAVGFSDRMRFWSDAFGGWLGMGTVGVRLAALPTAVDPLSGEPVRLLALLLEEMRTPEMASRLRGGGALAEANGGSDATHDALALAVLRLENRLDVHSRALPGADEPPLPTSEDLGSLEGEALAPAHFAFLDLAVLSANPLVFVHDRQYHALDHSGALDFKSEWSLLRSMLLRTSKRVCARVDIASTSLLSEVLAQQPRCLYLVCHADYAPPAGGGPPTLHLSLEDASGVCDSVSLDRLRTLLRARHDSAPGGSSDDDESAKPLSGVGVVVLGACHSLDAGRAFVAAGCRHVVAIASDAKVLDDDAALFARHFLFALFQGQSVRSAFERGRGVVASAANPRVAESTDRRAFEADKIVLLPEGAPHDERPMASLLPGELFELNPLPSLEPPTVPAPFVGRALELQALVRMLRRRRQSEVRLLTLWGERGVGKSALGKAVAQFLWQRRCLHDGAAFVELAGVTSEAAALAALGDALDMEFGRWKDASRALQRWQGLVLLDGCDDLLQTQPAVVGRMVTALMHGSQLQVLVTSCIPLSSAIGAEMAVEHPVRVEPLPPADAARLLHALVSDALPPHLRGTANLAQLAQHEVFGLLRGSPRRIVLTAPQIRQGVSLKALVARLKLDSDGAHAGGGVGAAIPPVSRAQSLTCALTNGHGAAGPGGAAAGAGGAAGGVGARRASECGARGGGADARQPPQVLKVESEANAAAHARQRYANAAASAYGSSAGNGGAAPPAPCMPALGPNDSLARPQAGGAAGGALSPTPRPSDSLARPQAGGAAGGALSPAPVERWASGGLQRFSRRQHDARAPEGTAAGGCGGLPTKPGAAAAEEEEEQEEDCAACKEATAAAQLRVAAGPDDARTCAFFFVEPLVTRAGGAGGLAPPLGKPPAPPTLAAATDGAPAHTHARGSGELRAVPDTGAAGGWRDAWRGASRALHASGVACALELLPASTCSLRSAFERAVPLVCVLPAPLGCGADGALPIEQNGCGELGWLAPGALAAWAGTPERRTRLAVLWVAGSLPLARALCGAGVGAAVHLSRPLGCALAASFLEAFLSALLGGQPIAPAFARARRALPDDAREAVCLEAAGGPERLSATLFEAQPPRGPVQNRTPALALSNLVHDPYAPDAPEPASARPEAAGGPAAGAPAAEAAAGADGGGCGCDVEYADEEGADGDGAAIVGRRVAIHQLVRSCLQHHLTALYGQTGAGKSAVARGAASYARARRLFPGGAFVADMRGVTSTKQLCAIIARTLGIEPAGCEGGGEGGEGGPGRGTTAGQKLIAATLLKRGKTLLVLDRCECAVQQCSKPLCWFLQRLCGISSVAIVLTSQLPLPEDADALFGADMSVGEVELGALHASEAAQLLAHAMRRHGRPITAAQLGVEQAGAPPERGAAEPAACEDAILVELLAARPSLAEAQWLPKELLAVARALGVDHSLRIDVALGRELERGASARAVYSKGEEAAGAGGIPKSGSGTVLRNASVGNGLSQLRGRGLRASASHASSLSLLHAHGEAARRPDSPLTRPPGWQPAKPRAGSSVDSEHGAAFTAPRPAAAGAPGGCGGSARSPSDPGVIPLAARRRALSASAAHSPRLSPRAQRGGDLPGSGRPESLAILREQSGGTLRIAELPATGAGALPPAEDAGAHGAHAEGLRFLAEQLLPQLVELTHICAGAEARAGLPGGLTLADAPAPSAAGAAAPAPATRAELRALEDRVAQLGYLAAGMAAVAAGSLAVTLAVAFRRR